MKNFKAYDSVSRDAMWISLEKLGVPEETIRLIKSFHQDMRVRIRLDGETMEDMHPGAEWSQTGLFHGTSSLKLYSCLAVERWVARTEGSEGVGISIKYKYDGRLFRRYVRNANERKITECQFADDGALLASTRPGAEKAALEYQQTSRNFGLKVNISKTKHMVTGRLVKERDLEPITLDGEDVEAVSEFPYVGLTHSQFGEDGL